MFKIQETSVVETGPDSANIELVISDNEELESASQYVVCSVLVSTEIKPPHPSPISLRILQTRAVKAATTLLGQV